MWGSSGLVGGGWIVCWSGLANRALKRRTRRKSRGKDVGVAGKGHKTYLAVSGRNGRNQGRVGCREPQGKIVGGDSVSQRWEMGRAQRGEGHIELERRPRAGRVGRQGRKVGGVRRA